MSQTGESSVALATGEGAIPEETEPDRRLAWIVWLVSALVLAGLLHGRFADPPFWDAAWTTSAGAAELSQNGFDYRALLAAPPFDQGGPGTHAGSLLTPLLGLFFAVFGSPGGLVAGHVLMVGLGGALVTATFALARRYLSTLVALFVAGLVMLLPLVVQQVADPYVEIPLALGTILTLIAVLDGSRPRAAVFAALAVWFKPTGLMLIPLLALMGKSKEPRRWLKNGVTAFVAVAPFSIQLIGRSMATHIGVEPSLDRTIFLFRNAVVTLGATTDVLLIAVLFGVAVLRQRRNHPALVRSVSFVTLGFFGILFYTMVSSQAVTILPRYYVAVVPLWIVLVAVDLVNTHSRRVGVAFFAVMISFSLINWNGSFYPLADHPHPTMAERTPGGAHEYLLLEIAGTEALAESAGSVDEVLLGQAMEFRFVYPELGFLSEVPANTMTTSHLEISKLGSFAWVQEPHVTGATQTPAEIAIENGWSVEHILVWEGRWESQLIVARRQ